MDCGWGEIVAYFLVFRMCPSMLAGKKGINENVDDHRRDAPNVLGEDY